ncbi:B12-binding domain-containing radical SAM protein [Caloramator australicus]|uniref:Fe-S oxidoreductase n=1 Tax=Caloramator australicus RC3 TaxID=857293 RepID=G0V4M7_9CLOT|nr:B12-binding domain-containing radical SAM protein [Caloramator australicus]CCC58067.1 Fe-S oxidoreductase [Caloramator australicus RC3]
MKVLLIALNSKYVHSNLAIRYLRAYVNEFDVEIFEGTINENPFNLALEIARKKPDVVAFSCYIWNIENILKICGILKEINKDITIILGGPEVSYDPKNILQLNEYIDYIIFGEGEETFKELLEYLSRQGKRKDLKSMKGLAFRLGEEIIVNEERPLITNLDTIPFPYDLEIPSKIVYYEASRGCPFSCKYCLSSTIKGVRFFSLERIKRDLKYLIDNDVKLVKFVDRTFNANKRMAIEIWEFLIQNSKGTKFHFEIAADLLDEDCFEVLKRAPKDLFQFEIGVQTTNETVLKNINRIMDFERVKNNVKRVMSMGNIHCHLDLIVGLPGEDFSSFRRSFEDVMDIKPDVLQIGFLKVLKGSPISFEAEEYGIKYSPYPPYQVLKTKDLSFEEVVFLLKFEEVFETFYNSHIFNNTIRYFLNKLNSYEFFSKLTIFLEENNFFKLNFDLNGKTKLLLEFLKKYEDEDIVKSLLIHDYLFTTKKGYLPEFFKSNDEINIKDVLAENKEIIYEKLRVKDFKSVFAVKVKVDIKEDYIYGNYILVINLLDKRFFYINM